MDKKTEQLVHDQQQQSLSTKQLDKYWSSAFGQLRLKRRQNYFLNTLDNGHLILEIGTGTGVMAQAFDKNKHTLISGELNDHLIKHGVEKGHLQQGRILCFDAHRLPFADNSFDGCFGNAILHHLNPVAALKELYRVIKPGTALIFSEPNMLNPLVWAIKNWDWLGRRFEETPGETAYYQKEFLGYAQEAGFENVSVITYDFCAGPEFLLPFIKVCEKIIEKTILSHFGSSHLLIAQKPE